MFIYEDRQYSEGELRMLLRAVECVLTCTERDVHKANRALRDTAIHIGLVDVDKRNVE